MPEDAVFAASVEYGGFAEFAGEGFEECGEDEDGEGEAEGDVEEGEGGEGVVELEFEAEGGEEAGAEFVSVTEALDTSMPMGRAMCSIIATFAALASARANLIAYIRSLRAP